jgi:hypothetical protein
MALTPGRMQWVALALTLALELGGALLWTLWRPTSAHRVGHRVGWTLLVVAGANLVTHPLFWLALLRSPLRGPVGLFLAEGAVAVVEALLYRRLLALSLSTALALSVALNLTSWMVGAALWQHWLSPAL